MRSLRAVLGVGLMVLVSVTAGCRTTPPPAPVNLAEPGWIIHRGQAIWRPRKRAPEMAGRFLIASRPGDQEFIRFSKDPMEIVLAQRSHDRWWMDLPALDRSFSGTGPPPARLGWFCLVSAVYRDAVPEGWEWSGVGQDRWTLVNPRTGERLEGVLQE